MGQVVHSSLYIACTCQTGECRTKADTRKGIKRHLREFHKLKHYTSRNYKVDNPGLIGRNFAERFASWFTNNGK